MKRKDKLTRGEPASRDAKFQKLYTEVQGGKA